MTDLSAILDQIYEAAFLPQTWYAILDHMALRTGAQGTSLVNTSAPDTKWLASDALDDMKRKMIDEGLALVDKALRHRKPGPYQVQAAIAALHARAGKAEDTDWNEIDLLYGLLEQMQPSPVVTLNRAVAVAKVRGPEAALAMIEPLEQRLSGYFHFFGLNGGLLMQLGRSEEARVAFDRAIALANTAAEAAHIRMHIDRLIKEGASPTGQRSAR